MEKLTLGLDFGTGGAKACVIDVHGRVRGYAFEEYPLIHTKPGWSEHDADNYWQAACRLLRAVIAQAGIHSAVIHGVAVSSALPSLVMVDSHHRPIHRAYNLMDKRAIDQVQWLKDEIGEEVLFPISGYRLEDHPVLVNVLWEKANRPESYQKIRRVLTIDGFITLKLTGRAILNYSAAAFYGVAYNLRQRCFDESLLRRLGIDPELMPQLCDCHAIVGGVTRQAAEESGLAEGTPVAGGQVDCNASWIGAGAVSVGDFQCNLGTVGNFGIIHQNSDFMFSDIGRLMINFPYTLPDTYITVPTTTTGGQCIRYIRDQFSRWEIEQESLGGGSAYDALNQQAEQAPPGSGGLIVLPFFMGERTPIWDVHARAVFFGLSLDHSKGHLVRAMMEAVAYALYDSYRLIRQAGLAINYPMVLNEGGAVSPLWRQIIADVFDIPVVLAKNRAGAPFGDAILAGVATEVFPDFTIAREWAEFVEPLQPNPAHHALYMEYFDLYKRLYENVKDDFRILAELRAKSYQGA